MQETLPEVQPLKLLITIVNRSAGKAVIDALLQEGLNFHIACRGRGTASSEILQYLNLSATEKAVIFTSITEDKTHKALETLQKTFDLKKDGNGVAFTVPIKSVGGAATLKMLSGFIANQGEI